MEASAEQASLPRRALRKGTRSCAECKARKVRCFFDRPESRVCAGCRSRGIRCIGQEFTDIPVSRPSSEAERSTGDGDHDTRLKRIEHMVGQILDQVTTPNRPGRQFKQTPQISALHAALPSQHDTDVFFGSSRAAVYVYGVCNPWTDLPKGSETKLAAALSILPPPSAHPVLIARKLLHLANCIQQMDVLFDRTTLTGLGSEDLHAVMDRYYTLAANTVTCRDELVDSLEGFECLIFEALYLVNCGRLRRALGVLRRAVTFGQLMGLHKARPNPPPRSHDTAMRISLPYAWMHVVWLERVTALLLGLPTSVVGLASFATRSRQPTQSPTAWFELAQTDILERIVAHNATGRYDDVFMTRQIDIELSTLSSGVPNSWWAPPQFRMDMAPIDGMEYVIRAQAQIVHFTMLIITHLPFLLQVESGIVTGETNAPASTNALDLSYSKHACLYAAREVLSRYMNLRAVVRVVLCCRPVDFCAFTAALALLMSRLVTPPTPPSASAATAQGLNAHQHRGDRTLLEGVADLLKELQDLNADEMTREFGKLVQRLLHLDDANVERGGTYRASVAAAGGGGGGGGDGDDIDDDSVKSLAIHVPYFGTVTLVHDATSSSATSPAVAGDAHSALLNTTASTLSPDTEVGTISTFGLENYSSVEQDFFPQDVPMTDLLADTDTWAFQGVDAAFFNSLMGPCSSSDEAVWAYGSQPADL